MSRFVLVAVVVVAVDLAGAASAGEPTALRAVPAKVMYGGATTLSGTVAAGPADEKVAILGEGCGETSFREVASVARTTGGAFTATLRPRSATTYKARARNATSAPILVKVRPQLVLLRSAPETFGATVVAADSLAGKDILFQRYSATRHRFVTVRRVTLAAGAIQTAPLVPSVTSTASFHARIGARLRVRVVLPASQAAPCYLSARSVDTRS